MKKLLALLLVLIMVLSLSACAANNASNAASYEGMSAEAAAEAAAEATSNNFGLSDIVRVPFGYLLEWLYVFTNNYGVALLLFSLIVKIVLLPMSVKSKKTMMKTSRLAPELKAMEAQYGDDKAAYQQAVSAFYKEEGIDPTGGCLWGFIPLLILLPLYYVIREPLTYMLHNSRSVSAAIVAYMQVKGADLGKNSYYAQLMAASYLKDYIPELKALAVTSAAKLKELNFSFLGMNLAAVPDWHVWNYKDWGNIGLCLIPILSGGFQVVSMLISQKLNNSVITNKDGERDDEAVKTQNQTTMSMMLMMPLMSLWIGYSMPAAISIYWIAQALIGTVQEIFLSKYCAKAYAAEDAERRERAAARAAEQAEKERLRALRKEQNPEGIVDNTSKKKLKQREKEAERAAKLVDGKLTPEEREALRQQTKVSTTGGTADRPYCRGRAYAADRYDKNGNELVSEELPTAYTDDYEEPDAEASVVDAVEETETEE